MSSADDRVWNYISIILSFPIVGQSCKPTFQGTFGNIFLEIKI